MPQTLAIISLISTVAGTAVSVSAQQQQSKAIAAQGKHDAQVAVFKGVQGQMDARAEAGARIANAKQMQDEAQMRAQMEQKRGRADRAKVIGSLAKSGLDLGSESASDVLMSMAMDDMLKQNMALYDGAKSAEGELYSAENTLKVGAARRKFGEMDASNIGFATQNKLLANKINMYGTAISGIGSATGSGATYYANGTFGN